MTVSIYKNDIPENLDLGNEIAVDTETMGLKFGMDTSPYTEDEA